MKSLNEYLLNEGYTKLSLKDVKYVISIVDGYETGPEAFKTLKEVEKFLLDCFDKEDVNEIMKGTTNLKSNECFAWGDKVFVIISCLKD